ncbi:MAG: hypothetical protein ACFFC7_27665 [Candidatus Hermodarchaeota archaeon]
MPIFGWVRSVDDSLRWGGSLMEKVESKTRRNISSTLDADEASQCH